MRPGSVRLLAHLLQQFFPGFFLLCTRALQQVHALHHIGIQRCALHDLHEPAMEGADGDAGLRQQHLFIKTAGALQLLIAQFRDAAFGKKLAYRALIAHRQIAQPQLQARLHLLRRFAREGDGQDLRRLGAVQQQAHDARHQ